MWKIKMNDMTSHETEMMLGILTFIFTLISLIVKVLFVIVERNRQSKKHYAFGQCIR